jgi:hypothetical protein
MLAACAPSDFSALSRGAGRGDAAGDAAALDGGGAGHEPDAAAGHGDAAGPSPRDGAGLDESALDSGDEPLPDAGGPPGDAAPSADDAGDANPADAGALRTVELNITSDADDGVWCQRSDGLAESTHLLDVEGEPGFSIEVGDDFEQCRAGLVFTLPFGPEAHVESAALRLYRVSSETGSGGALSGATMRVDVYNSSSVPGFSASHRESDARQHVAAGVWSGGYVGDFVFGHTHAYTQSNDLSGLIEHVLGLARTSGTSSPVRVGFLLSPENAAGGWAQYQDSFDSELGPKLRLSYRLPAP